jgi:Uma2 family endonuclease
VDVVRSRRRFTVAEYYSMGEAGILKPDERTELIEGEIIVMPPIGPAHSAGVPEPSGPSMSALADGQ